MIETQSCQRASALHVFLHLNHHHDSFRLENCFQKIIKMSCIVERERYKKKTHSANDTMQHNSIDKWKIAINLHRIANAIYIRSIELLNSKIINFYQKKKKIILFYSFDLLFVRCYQSKHRVKIEPWPWNSSCACHKYNNAEQISWW